jgi:hypothetical protein
MLIIVWTKHARERQMEWEKRLGLTCQEVELVARNPEQIVPGDQSTLVAQSRKGQGLIRVPFVEIQGERKLLTVYWTSQVKRYWKGDDLR